MLRQERYEDENEMLLLTLQGWQSGIWTAIPGILEYFNKDEMTCVVQPAIKGVFRQKDGTEKIVTMPQCLDVPVQFIGGGFDSGFVLTFPMKKGDEGLIVFASRCFDAWWQNGGVQPQAEIRMHDLSDGFFIPGFRNKTRKIENFNETDAELRNEAGDVRVIIRTEELELKIKDDTSVLMKDKEIHLKAGSSVIDMTDSEINIDGDTVIIKGIPFETHKHGGVQAGGANTGNPHA